MSPDDSLPQTPTLAESFEEQARLLTEVDQAGGLWHYLTDILGLQSSDIFRQKGQLGCMDERVPGISFGLAGSGILALKEAQESCQSPRLIWLKALEIASDWISSLRNRLDMITSHARCGAAAQVFQGLPADMQERFADSDDLQIKFIRELANKLPLPYSHVPFTEMQGSPDGHRALMTICDDIGGLSIRDRANVPDSFTITSAFFGPEEKDKAVAQVKLSTDIALGHHGFGHLITPEHPFRVVLIQNPSTPYSSQNLIQQLAALEARSNGRIKFEPTTLPYEITFR